MKPLGFVLLALVGSLILTNLPASYADPNLDTLLRIATQARDNIHIQLSQLSTVPDEINQLYKQGSGETDALAKSISQEDQASAKNHFLSAMKIFKELNNKISSLTPDSTSEQPQIDTSQLTDEINKIQKRGNSLKAIATKNNVEVNFTKFDRLMQDARQNLDAGNQNQVNNDLENANQFLLDTHHILADSATKNSSDRAKDFSEKEIQKLSQESSPVQNGTQSLATLNTTQTTNATQTENINEMIGKLRQLVSDGKIDDALKLIKMINALQNQEIRPQAPITETPGVIQAPVTNNVNASGIANPMNNLASIPNQTNSTTILKQTNSKDIQKQTNSTSIPKQTNSKGIQKQTNSTSIPKQTNPTHSDKGNGVNATKKNQIVKDDQSNNDNGKNSHGKKNNDSYNDRKKIKSRNSNN